MYSIRSDKPKIELAPDVGPCIGGDESMIQFDDPRLPNFGLINFFYPERWKEFQLQIWIIAHPNRLWY